MASNTNPAFATTSLVPICNFLVAFLCPNVPFFPCIWLLLTNHASIYLKPFSSDKKQQKKKIQLHYRVIITWFNLELNLFLKNCAKKKERYRNGKNTQFVSSKNRCLRKHKT